MNGNKKKGRKGEGVSRGTTLTQSQVQLLERRLQEAFSLHQRGDLVEAEKGYRRILQKHPSHANALHLMGVLALVKGANNEAENYICRAIEACNREPIFFNNLGTALLRQNKTADAEKCFQRALQLRPDYASGHVNYGTALKYRGELERAKSHFEKAVQLAPDSAEVYYNLGTVHQDQANFHEALAAYQRALQLNPGFVEAQSNFLFLLNYHEGLDPAQVSRLHASWGERVVRPNRRMPEVCKARQGKDTVIRVGYVSPDFRLHSVAFFMLPIIEGHDRRKFEVFCYGDVTKADDITREFEKHADHFYNIDTLSDEQVFAKIRRDRIDILVDLAGHSGRNRLSLFAQKPAPLQISYLGYPNTTGLPEIDFRVADQMTDPQGMTNHHFSEKLFLLPGCYICYRNLVDSPDEAETPCMVNKHVTFGSFNTGLKINDSVISLWSDILSSVEGAKLVIKAKHLADQAIAERWRSRFVGKGVDRRKLILLGHVDSTADHLKLYHSIDIALDTFPYNGTTTTCEALWMGVPVLTLEGAHHAARVGGSILTTVGLHRWIARSQEEYRNIAINWAARCEELAELRKNLRSRMRASSLMDEKSFLKKYEAALEVMWHGNPSV